MIEAVVFVAIGWVLGVYAWPYVKANYLDKTSK